MADPSLYTYPSPLESYQGLPPLSNEKAADGKSFINPPAEKKSEAYSAFVAPIRNDQRSGFDVHIYFLQTDEEEVKFANELWERIRREFPELRIYRVWDRPIGPHPMAMFEVNIFTPGMLYHFWGYEQQHLMRAFELIPEKLTWAGFKPLSVLSEQFGAFIPWLVVNRGPLSALIHPNSDDEERDHTQRATWMGQPLPLNLKMFKKRKAT